jgi:hypothetical protein
MASSRLDAAISLGTRELEMLREKKSRDNDIGIALGRLKIDGKVLPSYYFSVPQTIGDNPNASIAPNVKNPAFTKGRVYQK